MEHIVTPYEKHTDVHEGDTDIDHAQREAADAAIDCAVNRLDHLLHGINFDPRLGKEFTDSILALKEVPLPRLLLPQENTPMSAISNAQEAAEENPLQYTTKNILHVDYRDLEEFINQVTGKTFEFAAVQECHKHASYEFNGIGGEDDPLNSFDREGAESFLWGSQQAPERYITGAILQCMCERGMIPPGDYVIQVFW
jgi:hypothetical protein